MSERHLDASLRDLKEMLLEMGGYVERSVELATEAMSSFDSAHFTRVMEIEKKVNQAHIAIDDACLKLLALQQPLAADLRLIVAILKINTDLERMGDQAVNIADNAGRYSRGTPLKPLEDLPKMSHQVRRMVRESLDSFVRSDLLLAREVLARDDEVDALKHKVFRDTLDLLKAKPEGIEQGVTLILIARNLERIGDHATNIAEDVIFAITGDDIRHASKQEAIQGALR